LRLVCSVSIGADRGRDGAGYVASLVFVGRPCIENCDGARACLFQQLVETHRVSIGAANEMLGNQPVDLGEAPLGNDPH
jgi:hypothetical protein